MLDDQELADRLERCPGDGMKVVGLDLREREAILVGLDDPPAGLEELRAVLLQDIVRWREREGL